MTINKPEATKEKRFSVAGLSAKAATKIITDVNNEKKYWYTETRPMQNPVPNMSGRSSGSAGKSMVTFDKFIESNIDDSYLQFILDCLKRFPKFTLYVEDGPFGFYPVFGVLYKPSFFEKGSYILKLRKANLSEATFKLFVEHLYSKGNTNKHPRFKLEPIKELSHYDY